MIDIQESHYYEVPYTNIGISSLAIKNDRNKGRYSEVVGRIF
jgi:hypothetical protein